MKTLLIKKLNLACIIFVIFFIVLITFLPSTHLDADIYYHYKFASLLKNDFSLLTGFERLAYSITNRYSADLSYGYHLLFAPFTFIPDPVLAIKTFSLFLLLILLASFLYAFKKFALANPGLWLMVLIFGSTLFLERLTLSRPFLISLALTLLFLPQLFNKKYFSIFIISSLWSFFYVGWPLVVFLAAVYLFCQLIISRSFDFRLMVIPWVGASLGLLARTDFPNNLIMAYHQVYNSLQLKFSGLNLMLGTENQPLALFNFIDSSLIIFTLIIALLLIIPFIIKLALNNRAKQTLLFFYILTFTFLLATFLVTRFIEYLTIFVVLLSAIVLTLFKKSNLAPELNQLLVRLKSVFNRPMMLTFLWLAGLSLIFLPLITFYRQFKIAAPYQTYQTTAEWLKNNTPEDSIIFHTSWDTFPRLFFYNSHNRYLIGLDPTFMYLYNPQLYWQWRNITENVCVADYKLTGDCPADFKSPQLIAQTIKNQFNSEYIWAAECDFFAKFKKFLETNPEFFKKMIETEDSTVFQIINH